jgi:hypothetical protein
MSPHIDYAWRPAADNAAAEWITGNHIGSRVAFDDGRIGTLRAADGRPAWFLPTAGRGRPSRSIRIT